MKLYLDDVRKPPCGWTLVKTAERCIEILENNMVEELSLDHDLAEEHYDEENFEYIDLHGYVGELDRDNYRAKTGFHVVAWLTRQPEGFEWPKLIIVHSMNPVGRRDMLETLRKYAPEGVVIEERVGWCRS